MIKQTHKSDGSIRMTVTRYPPSVQSPTGSSIGLSRWMEAEAENSIDKAIEAAECLCLSYSSEQCKGRRILWRRSGTEVSNEHGALIPAQTMADPPSLRTLWAFCNVIYQIWPTFCPRHNGSAACSGRWNLTRAFKRPHTQHGDVYSITCILQGNRGVMFSSSGRAVLYN